MIVGRPKVDLLRILEDSIFVQMKVVDLQAKDKITLALGLIIHVKPKMENGSSTRGNAEGKNIRELS